MHIFETDTRKNKKALRTNRNINVFFKIKDL